MYHRVIEKMFQYFHDNTLREAESLVKDKLAAFTGGQWKSSSRGILNTI